MKYIFSTLSTDCAYLVDEEKGTTITIFGGANIANKNLITQQGAMTSVTDEDAALLEKNHTFQLHVQGGYIAVENKKGDADAVAKNLTKKDKSAPLAPSDFNSADIVVKTNQA